MTRTEVTLADLEDAFRRSEDHPVLIYKHSSTCGVSAAAEGEIEEFVRSRGVDLLQVVVQESRDVSDAIAESTQVTHETPQALLLHRGEVAAVLNHWGIRSADLERALDALGD